MPDYQKSKIYTVVNSVNDTIYVGSSSMPLLSQRMGKHRQYALEGRTSAFYTAMKELGVEKFTIQLHHVFPCNSVDELHAEENKTLDELIQQGKSVYNMMIQGKHSDETKARMSKTRTGVKKSDEARANMSKARKGLPFTDEHKRNLSQAKLGVARNYGCIGLYTDRGSEKWMFTYRKDGKNVSKSFACKKFGFDQAKLLAEAERKRVYPEWKGEEEEAINEQMALEIE